jgi:hypothetical protein
MWYRRNYDYWGSTGWFVLHCVCISNEKLCIGFAVGGGQEQSTSCRWWAEILWSLLKLALHCMVNPRNCIEYSICRWNFSFHFIYCIHVDPVTGWETSSQTMDIECVKYKKFKEIRTNGPSIVGTSQKSIKSTWHSHYMINYPCKKFIQLQ